MKTYQIEDMANEVQTCIHDKKPLPQFEIGATVKSGTLEWTLAEQKGYIIEGFVGTTHIVSNLSQPRYEKRKSA